MKGRDLLIFVLLILISINFVSAVQKNYALSSNGAVATFDKINLWGKEVDGSHINNPGWLNDGFYPAGEWQGLGYKDGDVCGGEMEYEINITFSTTVAVLNEINYVRNNVPSLGADCGDSECSDRGFCPSQEKEEILVKYHGSNTWTQIGNNPGGTGVRETINYTQNLFNVDAIRLYVFSLNDHANEWKYSRIFEIRALGPVCGDGVCELGENSTNCLTDCPIPITPHKCADQSQVILRLNDTTNAHIESYKENTYPIDICYNEIFGFDYTGSNPNVCTGKNKVIGVSGITGPSGGATDALGEIPEDNNYPWSICYGNLSCVSSTTVCASGYHQVLSLSASTGAYAELVGGSYPVKICCRNPLIESYFWARGTYPTPSNPIGGAIIGDTVKLVWLNTSLSAGTRVEFGIWENDTINDDPIRTGANNISTTVNADGDAIVSWTITQADYDAGRPALEWITEGYQVEFYFKAINPSKSWVSPQLSVTKTGECNDGDKKCVGYEYYECENLAWVNKSLIIGNCGVQCLSDSNCTDAFPNYILNYYCASDYTCKADEQCYMKGDFPGYWDGSNPYDYGSGGDCKTSSEDCCQRVGEQCVGNGCKTITYCEENNITVCSDYDQTHCRTDECGAKYNEGFNPITMNASSGCYWINENCKFVAYYKDFPFKCIKSSTAGECVNNRRDISWTVSSEPVVNQSTMTAAGCEAGSDEFPCGQQKLGFFGFIQFAITLALITLLYFFSNKNKKH